MKPCKGCGVTDDDLFRFVTRNDKQYRRGTCRKCENGYNKKRYDENPERFRELARQDFKNNKPERSKRAKRNRAIRLQKNPHYDKEMHVKHAERERLYRQEKREVLAAILREWRIQNPEKANEQAQRRRALKALAPIVEIIDRPAIIKRDRSTCYLCGLLLLPPLVITLDHVVPLTRGGNHTGDNLKVCCQSCNSRKGVKLLSEL